MSTILVPHCRNAATAPATIASGAWSPPIASTAMTGDLTRDGPAWLPSWLARLPGIATLVGLAPRVGAAATSPGGWRGDRPEGAAPAAVTPRPGKPPAEGWLSHRPVGGVSLPV